VTELPQISRAPVNSEANRDAVTVSLLLQGDPEGLRRLLLDHGATVRWTLRNEFRDVLDELQIDEALSHASQRVWKNGRRFDPSLGTLRSWLYVIARNCARRVLEVERRHSTVRYVDDLDAAAAPPTSAEAGEPTAPNSEPSFVVDLRRCIQELPRLQRAIVLADLAAGGSAPAKGLAATLATSTNSVYVSRNHARKAIRLAMLRLGHRFEVETAVDATGPRRPTGQVRAAKPRHEAAS
jgi:RNA polymerase sigma factor (sigma-70 family)